MWQVIFRLYSCYWTLPLNTKRRKGRKEENEKIHQNPEDEQRRQSESRWNRRNKNGMKQQLVSERFGWISSTTFNMLMYVHCVIQHSPSIWLPLYWSATLYTWDQLVPCFLRPGSSVVEHPPGLRKVPGSNKVLLALSVRLTRQFMVLSNCPDNGTESFTLQCSIWALPGWSLTLPSTSMLDSLGFNLWLRHFVQREN